MDPKNCCSFFCPTILSNTHSLLSSEWQVLVCVSVDYFQQENKLITKIIQIIFQLQDSNQKCATDDQRPSQNTK